jgi:outer membrane receptor protein involved in Fe transport
MLTTSAVRWLGCGAMVVTLFLTDGFRSASGLLAQVTGKVTGTVADRDSGQPLVDAEIVVEGTNLGNVTNEDGYYFLNGVPVGIQELTARYLGYQSTTQELRILAGQTMTVDFALPTEMVEVEMIFAGMEREPLIVRDNTSSKSRFTGEAARSMPVDDIETVVMLGAGVYLDMSMGTTMFGAPVHMGGMPGFVIRGGRVTESATYVDGALITDFNDQLNAVEVSRFAVEEVDVVTGGFNAEFGHAQSGIVNIVTREGGREVHGNVRFTTDEFSDAIEQSYGYNNLQVSIGGPIFPERLMAYGSFEATGAKDFFPTAAGFNPATGNQLDNSGSTKELLPGNRGDRTQAQGKLTAFLPWDAKVTSTYLYSRDQIENYQHSVGLNQFLSPTTSRTKTHDLILGYDQTIFQTADRNLQLQVRGQYHLSKFHSGTPLTRIMSGALEAHYQGTCGSACIADEDAFEEDFLNYRFGDVEFFFEDSLTNSVFNFPQAGGTNPDPIFGKRGIFPTVPGFFPLFSREDERRYGLRVDLDSQVNRVHRAKLGLERNWINLNHVGPFFDSNGFADVWDVDPMVGAAYIQDRMDYGDLVIDLGLRWDHWDPNTTYPKLPGLVDCSISPLGSTLCREAEVQRARTRNAFSPRLGVAHPITDDTQVRLSYGKFYQLPELQNFFTSFLTDIAATGGNTNTPYGNPNLDFIETTAFEVGITHLISPNLVLDVVGYNRDRRGAIRLELFPARAIDPLVDERRVFVNGDNGNVKGFDITLSKRYSNYWSTNLTWSLQWARGTTSSPQAWATVFGRLQDPLEGPGVLLAPPTKLQPEDFDRLHNLNWLLMLQFPGDFRPGSFEGALLRDAAISLMYNAQSGTPYTRTLLERPGIPAEDFGSSRLPWIHSGNIRLAKGFELGELDLGIFTLVENFLNRTNVLAVHPESGRPDMTGFEFTNSRDPQIPGTFRVEGAPPGFPVALSDIVEEWRDEFARQDLDGDDVITLEESQETGFRGLRAVSNSPLQYGAPRQIRFGVELRF